MAGQQPRRAAARDLNYVLVRQRCCSVAATDVAWHIRLRRGPPPPKGFRIITCPRCGMFAVFLPGGAADDWYSLAALGLRDDAKALAAYAVARAASRPAAVRRWAETAARRWRGGYAEAAASLDTYLEAHADA